MLGCSLVEDTPRRRFVFLRLQSMTGLFLTYYKNLVIYIAPMNEKKITIASKKKAQ